MPRIWREEYSEEEDYDLEWSLREKYSSRGLSPRGRGRRRLRDYFRDSDDEDDRGRRRLRDYFRDWDDEDDRGRLRHSRPYFANTDIVIAPAVAEKEKPPECKYKCCPCHAEKLAATCAAACAGQHMVCHPVPANNCGGCKPAEKKKPEEPKILVDVEDRTDGPLARRHGRLYTAAIAPKATVNDIISTLTPDRHRHKILVKWLDGYNEELESVTMIEELRHYAWRLVITTRNTKKDTKRDEAHRSRSKKKQVHYAERPCHYM